jgi:acyl carrier protein
MIFSSLRQSFRTARQKIALFCAGRSRQPDDQFAAECGLPTDAEAARIAVAVRRAVADIGSIDPEFIRADDAYPDQLGVLPLWDSMDWMAFIWALEEKLGTRLSVEETMAQLLSPERMSVKEWAAGIHRLLARREKPETARQSIHDEASS